MTTLPGLPEASGLAPSRQHPGLLWSHNDSGTPVLFALNEQGVVHGRVQVTGARVDDWEDIATGPCPQGACLYIADIGDNGASRPRITVYRVPEPAPDAKATASAESFHATFPDGPHDAEALFVTSPDNVFIVTKSRPTELYRFPRPLRADSTARLERVATLEEATGTERVTGAAASPDGRWVVLRTHRTLLIYRAASLVSGRVGEAFRYDVSSLKEPQGEGVAIAADGTIYLAGEGRGRGGTLARVSCTLPS